MIIPDVNILVYAHNQGAPLHLAAKEWWQSVLNSRQIVGLAPVVALGFIRLLSSPKVVLRPVAPDRLLKTVQVWLELGNVRLLTPGIHHFDHMERFFIQTGAGSGLTTDIHLAALTLEHRGTLHSNDTDFLRFEGLSLVNPL